jgi:hypothetical protein
VCTISTLLHLAPHIDALDPATPIAEISDMRDCRFVQLETGIGFFPRPNGWIGFTMLDGLEEVTDKQRFGHAITRANQTLLSFTIDGKAIPSGTRLGMNSAYLQKDGSVRLICHTSSAEPVGDFTTGMIHYAGYDGIFDPYDLEGAIDLREIVRSVDFPRSPGDSKGKRYEDVAFPCGIDGKEIYVGVRDRCVGVIPDVENKARV